MCITCAYCSESVCFPFQAVTLAKFYTRENDNSTAVRKFREVLESRDMFFNVQPFPANESGEAAYFLCTAEQTSRLFCPARWKAMQKWIETTTQVSHIHDPDDNDKFLTFY